MSDQRAIEALAARRGRDLAHEGVGIVPIGGAQAIGRALERYGPAGLGLRLAGLCDAGEERDYRLGLERAGLGTGLSRQAMEHLGFGICEDDLEDELIRAVGPQEVEQLLAAEGDLGAFRTLQKQPAWRGRPTSEQLRRFFGSGSGRKIRYAQILVSAVELDRVPRPLDIALSHV